MKEFFQKKAVKLTAWIVMALSTVVLIIGGANAEAISGAVVIVAGIVGAVSGLIAYIGEKVSD